MTLTIRHPHRRSHSGLRELGIFALGYLVYVGVRALTEGRPGVAVDNAVAIFEAERDLGIAVERSVQDAVLPHQGLVEVLNAIYIWGHWPLLIVGGIVLFHLSRGHYVVLRDVCLVSGAFGLILFALVPVAPPRLAGLGVDTVTLHASTYREVLPPSLINEYAAMPSFHAGWNLLLGIALFRASTHLLVRAFAVVMPLAMAFAVVATANHYVLDVAAGAIIVVVALVAVERLGHVVPPPRLARSDDRPSHGRAGRPVRGGAPGR